MLIVTAEMKSIQGKRNEFINAAKECVAKSRLEEGCLGYDCFASTEDENAVFFFERYIDKGAFKSHIKSQHFADFSVAIKDISDGEIKPVRYEIEDK